MTRRYLLQHFRDVLSQSAQLRNGFRPMTPYRWRQSNGLLEMPLTTMPIIRIPIHMSYLLCLASFSRGLAASYFQFALKLCRLRGISPSLLLHPLDFLGRDDRNRLGVFPCYDAADRAETPHRKRNSVDLFQLVSSGDVERARPACH